MKAQINVFGFVDETLNLSMVRFIKQLRHDFGTHVDLYGSSCCLLGLFNAKAVADIARNHVDNNEPNIFTFIIETDDYPQLDDIINMSGFTESKSALFRPYVEERKSDAKELLKETIVKLVDLRAYDDAIAVINVLKQKVN